MKEEERGEGREFGMGLGGFGEVKGKKRQRETSPCVLAGPPPTALVDVKLEEVCCVFGRLQMDMMEFRSLVPAVPVGFLFIIC